MEKEEKRLNHLLAEYTPDKYEQNRIYIQQEDQNKFKVVCNPATATTATYMYTKERILQELDSIYRVIEDLKDEEYHMVKGDAEKDGFVVVFPFKKNKYKHKKSHKKLSKRGRSPKKASKSPKKTLKSPKKTLKSPKKTLKSPKKTLKSPKKTSKSPKHN
jgi:hypothetical protein